MAEFDSLPESYPFVTHLLAGALAGISEHCVMYPIDNIKVCFFAIFATSNCILCRRTCKFYPVLLLSL